MAGEVAAQLHVRLFPAAQGLSRGGQARGQTEGMQQPVGFEVLQEAPIELHQRQLRGADEADAVQVEGLRLRLHGVLYGSGSGRHG